MPCQGHFSLAEGETEDIRKHKQKQDEGKEYESISGLRREEIRVKNMQEGADEEAGIESQGIIHSIPCAVPAMKLIGKLAKQGKKKEGKNKKFMAEGV